MPIPHLSTGQMIEAVVRAADDPLAITEWQVEASGALSFLVDGDRLRLDRFGMVVCVDDLSTFTNAMTNRFEAAVAAVVDGMFLGAFPRKP